MISPGVLPPLEIPLGNKCAHVIVAAVRASVIFGQLCMWAATAGVAMDSAGQATTGGLVSCPQ